MPNNTRKPNRYPNRSPLAPVGLGLGVQTNGHVGQAPKTIPGHLLIVETSIANNLSVNTVRPKITNKR